MSKVKKTEEEWKAILSPEEYRICRGKGTEPAFTGAYWRVEGKTGSYHCRCCDAKLFASADKFDSGSGWPSFTQAADPENVEEEADVSLGMHRTEAICAVCDAHLGHVFPDGPAPTGLRYCINSASLTFRGEQENSGH